MFKLLMTCSFSSYSKLIIVWSFHQKSPRTPRRRQGERTGAAPVTESRTPSVLLRAPNQTPASPRSRQNRPPILTRVATAFPRPATAGRKPKRRVLRNIPSAPRSRASWSKASVVPSTCLSASELTDPRWRSWRRSSRLTNLLSWSSSLEGAAGIWWGPSRSCFPAGVLTGARTRTPTRIRTQ